MTDMEWIKAVRHYVTVFGFYNFSQTERARMQPYIHEQSLVRSLLAHAHLKRMQANIVLAYDLMNEMERGIAEAVAAKLTQ